MSTEQLIPPSRPTLPSSSGDTLAPLRRWLTRDALAEAAGARLFKQGQTCLSQRRVTSFKALPDALHGTVLDRQGQPLVVALSPDVEGFACECQCSTFWDQGFCKHIVALGLAFLQAGGPVSEEAPPPPSKERPQTVQALEAWLEAHHVTHARRIPLAVVESLLPRGLHETPGLHGLAHLPVTAPLDGSLDLRRQVRGAATQALLQEAAWTWLGAEAERVRRGLEREQERSAVSQLPPTDGRLVTWREALERVRAGVREHAVPRLLPGRPDVTLQERPLFLFVEEPGGRVASLSPRDPWSGLMKVRVSVDPRALLEGREGLSCWCTPGGGARCVHVLTALDALLDMLAEPLHASFNARLAELLFEVPRREILTAFDKAITHAQARPTTTAWSTFRLEGLENREPRLRLFMHRPVKKGGFSKGAPVSFRDRDEARATLQDSRELEAFELCELISRLPYFDAYTLMLRALRLLAGSPRLFIASRLDAPLQVREAPLGFTFDESERGLTVQPSIEGVPFAPGELLPPPSAGGALQPWLFFERELPRLTLVSVPPGASTVLTTLREYGTRLPGEARPALLHSLAGIEASYPVSLPESLEARAVAPEPGFLLRLRPTTAERLEGTLFVRPLPEAPPLPAGEGALLVRGLRRGERVVARRELESERAEVRALRERLGVPMGDSLAHFTLEGAEAALDFLGRLEPLAGPGLEVEWEQQPWKVLSSPDARPEGGGTATARLVRRGGRRGGGGDAGGPGGPAGRIETLVPVVLSEGERRLYERVRLDALARVGDNVDEGQRFELLAALTRLRLLACHPRLGDPDSPLPSSKLERLLERVEELRAEGGRALVFSQFVQLLGLAREALEARGVSVQYLDGQTPPAERQARVEAFQRGEGDVFLISLRAGGTGLNLTAADHVIHLDPWWNPAVEDQATDRAHRIGQTRPVTVSRLVSEGTVEEAIVSLHAEKRELAASLLSEASGAAALTPEQILALLRFTSEGQSGPSPLA